MDKAVPRSALKPLLLSTQCLKAIIFAHFKLAAEVLQEAGQGQLNMLTHNVLNEEAV